MDDLVSPLEAVCSLDPAIDWEASDVSKYIETRDLTHLQYKPGMTPTKAVLRALTVADFVQLDALGTVNAKLLMAFRIACTAVTGVHGTGASLAMAPSTNARIDGVERRVWGDAELGALCRAVGVRFVYELGHVAFERALVGNDWGGGVCYTLPQSSLEGLGRKRHHPVAQSPASAGTGSSERLPEGSTPALDASSGAAGGASAASGETAPAAS